MEVLSLIGYSMVGAIFWVVNVEAMAIYYGATRAWNPLLVGVILATGQNLTYVLLYFGGDRALQHWKRLRTKVENARSRLKGDTTKGFLWMTGVGAIFGIPPAVAMPMLAPGFNVRLKSWLPITYGCRIFRFTVMAWFGESIYAWWNAF